MISFETTRFGRLETTVDKLIHFPDGLIGFPEATRFILMDYKDTSLKWLQSVDQADIAFIVMTPFEIFPDYSFKFDAALKDFLETQEIDDVVTLTMLRVDGENVTANLQGPLLINSLSKKGLQLVNDDPRYSCQTPLHIDSSTAETEKS
ncbi:MAG: flagellar assembly protein FliW [Nitrospira sp.]|nr:flagellar assembly protein FliW [Nitrospira sp.]